MELKGNPFLGMFEMPILFSNLLGGTRIKNALPSSLMIDISSLYKKYVSTICGRFFVIETTNTSYKFTFRKSNFMHLSGIQKLFSSQLKISGGEFCTKIENNYDFNRYLKYENLNTGRISKYKFGETLSKFYAFEHLIDALTSVNLNNPLKGWMTDQDSFFCSGSYTSKMIDVVVCIGKKFGSRSSCYLGFKKIKRTGNYISLVPATILFYGVDDTKKKFIPQSEIIPFKLKLLN